MRPPAASDDSPAHGPGVAPPLPDPVARRLGPIEVATAIEARIRSGGPLSLIRLGDGEGRVLGYPELVPRKELDESLALWFGRTDFPQPQLADMTRRLQEA